MGSSCRSPPLDARDLFGNPAFIQRALDRNRIGLPLLIDGAARERGPFAWISDEKFAAQCVIDDQKFPECRSPPIDPMETPFVDGAQLAFTCGCFGACNVAVIGTNTGIVIFEAEDEEAAMEIMQGDPTIVGGHARGELRPFKVSLLRGEA